MDYYRLLEVDRRASQEVIEKAHRVLSLRHHPDRQGDSRRANANERMKLINEAYALLSDPDRRAAYDEALKTEMWRVFYNDGLLGLVINYLRD